ncbi:VTC domain-containing protein [Spongisporangium articulatum]|uniref:VTC domain-containing protein n=1 Tax=Spongisporangium articulatum TaxID=3362603 RepID=A0ABW8AQE6_9ACTN
MTALDERVALHGYRPDSDRVLAALDLGRLATATLAEVSAVAALQTRVDRKYLLDVRAAHVLVERLRSTHHVLGIDGRRSSAYASVYFDSPDWQSFRAHAQGRRRRWKIRTRTYLEDDLCRLELKTKDGRGFTVKEALELPATAFGGLTPEARDFLLERAAAQDLQVDVDGLRPGVRIDYARATLCNLGEATRLTIDGGLVASLGGRVVRMRPDHVLVETKGGLRPSHADRILLDVGVRPVSVSKYTVAASLLEPSLSGHQWRPTARRFFERTAA